MLTITRKLEFDAGHRIPDHKSQCKNLHGHRYVMYITLQGDVTKEEGHTQNGMVLDFSDVRELAQKHLINHWDHAFLVYKNDTVVKTFLDSIPGHKTVVLDCVPTVENMAQVAFDILSPVYQRVYGKQLVLKTIRIYETPNCWAEVSNHE